MTPLRYALFLACAATLRAQTPAAKPSDAALAHAKALLATTPLVDGHNDLPWAIRESKTAPRDIDAYDLRKTTPHQTDLARMKAGQLGGQFWSVYIPGEVKDSGYARIQLEQIDIARRVIAKYPERLVAAATAADMRTAFKAGKVGSMLGMEGGHAIENSLGALRAYYGMGVRYMTLTHNVTLDWADAALDVAAAPVIFSHSSAKALVDHPRNVPDSILKRLPKNGGVVMVTFVPGFDSPAVRKHSLERSAYSANLKARVGADTAVFNRALKSWDTAHPAPHATIADVANHLDYIKKTASADNIGIGSDFDGVDDELPDGLQSQADYPMLFAELIRRGWTDAELRKLAGENVLRALSQAEQVAKRLQQERPPSTKTIQEMDGKPRM